ncbi:glycine zipper family protein [Ameyamaea chiangmaiensis]|uniref:glycine zipper family protein n=1 Tax=Ameyamaea chiangmaiensis TaxID=442969 RepID=UPI001FE2F2FB|nr:glycine zipper family protein [Ameyamaea chiangmaiensis]
MLLSACAETPQGPMVPVVPAQGKAFAQFTQESTFCKYQATRAVNGQAARANGRAVLGALIPTALGAGLGAAVGSAYGGPWRGSYAGTGAGIGAGAGALVGGGMAAASSTRAQGGIQMQYDNTYAACMVTYGNVVPGMGMQSGGPPGVQPMGPPPQPPMGATPYRGGYGSYGGAPGAY